jgi:hypothetical protein
MGSLLQLQLLLPRLLLPSSKAAIIITHIATTASILSFSVQQEGKNKQKQAPQTQWLFSSSSSSFLSLTFVSFFYIYYYSWHTTQY